MFKKVHVFRVGPGQELISAIASYCKQRNILSGLVLGIVGSLERARLNFLVKLPGQYVSVDYAGPLEIVCAQGSVALKEGELLIHVHIQLSDQRVCRGGHLAEARVFSTAEVAIGELDYQLQRAFDEYTGLNELANSD